MIDPITPVWEYDLIYHIPTKRFYRAWKNRTPPNSFKILYLKRPLYQDPRQFVLPQGDVYYGNNLRGEYWSLARMDNRERIW